jgi:hypothetical protein
MPTLTAEPPRSAETKKAAGILLLGCSPYLPLDETLSMVLDVGKDGMQECLLHATSWIQRDIGSGADSFKMDECAN